MSYVDAIHDKNGDVVHVVERTNDGRRVYQQYPINWVFYYEDPRGKFRSIYNDSVSRFSSRKRQEFQKELRIHRGKKIYESDVNPVFKCLAENYLTSDPPKLHTIFFDIETDFNPERGFASTTDSFNPVNQYLNVSGLA